MNTETKVIHSYVYEPSKLSDRAVHTTIRCSNSENCDLYKRGECSLLVPIFSGHRCEYGSKNKETGFTKRARNYYKWVSQRKEANKDTGSLKYFSTKIAQVGEFIFLPYPHMDLNQAIPFKNHSGFFSSGDAFIKKDDFTISNIIKICDYKPQAMFGGEIKSYQNEQIPKFVIHLKEQFPKIFDELSKEYPRVLEIVKNHSNIGRSAIIETLNPNVGTFPSQGVDWVWDGEYLKAENYSSFIFIAKADEIRVKPKPGQYIKITDDLQVNENTVFEV